MSQAIWQYGRHELSMRPALPFILVPMQTGCAQDEVIVTRAPGRLDVMGGIGDYTSAAQHICLHVNMQCAG